jgi:ferritin
MSSAMNPTSRARHNFHPEVEEALSGQINVELSASYVYLAMASFFDRDNVALPGFAKFYSQQAKEVNYRPHVIYCRNESMRASLLITWPSAEER